VHDGIIVLNDPVNKVDPYGLVTEVIIISGFQYPHAAVYVDNNGSPKLFDPNGSFWPYEGPRTSLEVFDAPSSLMNDYFSYHVNDGSKVTIYYFETTVAEEAMIAKRMDELSDSGSRPYGLYCASWSSEVIKGIGPFKDLKNSLTPWGLGWDMRRIQESQPRR
jgi:hypothetical protein